MVSNSTPGIALHVFDHSFPMSDGYALRSGEIIRFLRRMRWRTIHVTSAKQEPTPVPRETVDGLEFYRTQPSRVWRNVPVFGQLGVVTTLRSRLAELVRVEHPALLHVHSPCLNGLAALSVARRYNIPIIYEIRALWEDGAANSGVCREGDLRYRLSRMLETYVCRKVDHVVTICQGLRAELLSRGLDSMRITVVPNSIDLDRFSRAAIRDTALAKQLTLVSGKTFGFLGTFFPYEGLDVLLRAVPLIRAREPQARFVIVGDGPDGARIRALAKELGIEDAVVFPGQVPHTEVDRYYDLIDVLVYPRVSARVTELVTPLKPLEAMAKGKLVVASNVGGHCEMVFPGRNGILFKAGDSLSLAESCLQLMDRPQDWDALREGGRNYVREARRWECNVAIYDRLYKQVLADREVT
jgi:PEP-CTERM/exosortase A-associated glycosyltransferase